jgi:hypothetical protein
MATAEKKSLRSPDETRKFANGKMDLVNLGGGSVGLATFEPGWKWSNDVKPIAGTELCEAPHFMYLISGRMKIVFPDGKDVEVGPGDVAVIPPGHDGWVVGNEPAVVIDWGGSAANYAKR